MLTFHAVMIDETGCEFYASVRANNQDDALDMLAEEYPESYCDQLETDSQVRDREHDTYARAARYHDDPIYDDYDY